MIDNFVSYRDKMKAHFDHLMKEDTYIFQVDVNKNAFYQLYLNSFPAAMNPMYRVRREFDCSCCHHFLNQIGSTVIWDVKNHCWTTIWDFDAEDSGYNQVNQALHSCVINSKISRPFFTDNAHMGQARSFEGSDRVRAWDHYTIVVPQKFVVPHAELGSRTSQWVSDRKTFMRTLEEISLDAMKDVYEWCVSRTLYRGETWVKSLDTLINCKSLWDSGDKNFYSWTFPATCAEPVLHIRNSSIGALLQNLSKGMDPDQAMRAYESIVAPGNYQRSKPIFTQRMLEQAKKTVMDLGYADSLARRFATEDDISIGDVLFVNRDERPVFNDPFAALGKQTENKQQDFFNAPTVSIDEFIDTILPQTQSVEAYFENRLAANLCSLIAPVNKESKSMFKWNNGFSWAYSGNIADSDIRENVAKAGGKVDGFMRFSIQWNDKSNDYNKCDYDAHCLFADPRRTEIYYGHMRDDVSHGQLDVDRRYITENEVAVENIVWSNKALVLGKDQTYNFAVVNYESFGCQSTSGFRAELVVGDEVYHFDYSHYIRQRETVPVASVVVKKGKITVIPTLPAQSAASRKIWDVPTNKFTPVSLMCYSPNYWQNNAAGLKHYFFMLKDCQSDEIPNGFYNEFLNSELLPHRKVFEALGAQMAVAPASHQLSGLGFCASRRNTLTVRINHGKIMNIQF